MQITFSGTAAQKIHSRWKRRRINAIARRVESFTKMKLPTWSTLRIHNKRRGYGHHGGSATIPMFALLPDKEELYGVYYIVHELLHVLRFDHGPKMQSMERNIVATFGGKLCYGPADPSYPVAIKDRQTEELLCNHYGQKPAWFYEI